MTDSETGELSSASDDLESEGLSGIDLSIDENHALRIDGMASNFRDGKGTREEPLEPRVSLDLEISLKDANYLANLLEAHMA
jgi:hypothetical protein